MLESNSIVPTVADKADPVGVLAVRSGQKSLFPSPFPLNLFSQGIHGCYCGPMYYNHVYIMYICRHFLTDNCSENKRDLIHDARTRPPSPSFTEVRQAIL